MERRRDIVYNYGVEIETVLVPKGGSPSFTTNEFFLYLRDFYNQSKDDGSMEAHTDICGNVSYNISDPGYTAWTFTTDITIDPRDELLGTDHHPIEIVSPVLFADPRQSSHLDLELMFQIIERRADFEPNDNCSTHVHISPDDGGWTFDHLKQLSKAIIYFDHAFAALVPPTRRRSGWAVRNRYQSGRATLSVDEWFSLIEGCCDQEELTDLMSPIRTQAWNFQNLNRSKGTVEFRQPPPVTTQYQCIGWVELTVGFVDSSRIIDAEGLFDFSPDVEGLWEFVTYARELQYFELDCLNLIFKDKSGSIGWTSVTAVDPELEEKKSQEARKPYTLPDKFDKAQN